MRQRQDPDELLDRARRNDPIIDTMILDAWADVDLPMRGERRQRVLDRVRSQIKQRRTTDAIAIRVADLVSQPITNAVETEARERVRGQVRDRIEDMAEKRGLQ